MTRPATRPEATAAQIQARADRAQQLAAIQAHNAGVKKARRAAYRDNCEGNNRPKRGCLCDRCQWLREQHAERVRASRRKK